MNIKIIAEIGINHNGDVELAKKLIDLACVAGCDYVKFQKRTPELCVPEEQKNKVRETPWGKMTYLEYKERIEFGKDEYDEIALYTKRKGIKWFASVWDIKSTIFMSNYVDITKVPSALIVDKELLKTARHLSNTFLISTGMSEEKEIEDAAEVGDPDVIFHTNSVYPSPVEDLNLNYITWLKEKYPQKEIGYSGHEYGLVSTFATAAMGASWIERHITLDHAMWGSDHRSSLEPSGVFKLTKGIRELEKSFGEIGPRACSDGEVEKRKSLRK